MTFQEFAQRAVTALIGAQQSDGSWYSDPAATCGAIEVLLDNSSGPQTICRQSLLYRLSQQSKPPDSRGPVIRLYYDDPAPLNRGYRSLTQFWESVANPWLAARVARVLSVTDFDSRMWFLGRVADVATTEFARREQVASSSEAWLIAQSAEAVLHSDHPYDQSPQDKSDILPEVERLSKLYKDSHWQSESVSPEETTGIVASFLFHSCTVFLAEQLGRSQLFRDYASPCAQWLLQRQRDSGEWLESPHVTSHCLSALLNMMESDCTEAKLAEDCQSRAMAAVQYLLAPEILRTWDRLSSYQSLDILLTLLRASRSDNILDTGVIYSTDVESDVLAPRVFISYGGCDREFACRLANDLERNGINVWFAEWDIDYGDDVVRKIEEGLIATQKFVIILSNEALGTPWVRQELSTAFHQSLSRPGKMVIPIQFKPCDSPPFLATKKRIDFTDGSQYGERVLDLVRNLKGLKRRRS